MEKFSLDRQWKFHNGDISAPLTNSHAASYMAAKAGGAIGTASPDYDTSSWENVDLPHDFAVFNDFEEKWGPANSYKKRGKAWYVKRFRLDEADRNKQIIIEFGGVSSHCTVYMNGSVVGRNFGGYNSFAIDVTDMAVYGDRVNHIAVFVDAEVIEGWWYEGAGIYRHVDLYKRNPLHIAHRGVFVHPEKRTVDMWDALTDTEIENMGDTKKCRLVTTIRDIKDNIVGKAETAFECADKVTVKQSVLTYSPDLWDIDSPNLYTMVSELYDGDTLADRAETSFGFRTIEIDKDNGFQLNGRRIQLYGTCNHQDHAGVGVAVPDSVNEYRIRLLKEMGTNAYRSAHGNPSPEILDYCDKYGILVMDENRNFNTSADGLKQVRDMVTRDRNHPCVVMYSLFNEEPLQGTPTGRRLAKRMEKEIKELDDTRFILGAMNTGLTSDGGVCDALDLTGFNYVTHIYDEFREKYPDVPMLGTENDSAFATRGEYKTDWDKHIIDNYDSEKAPWGNSYRDGFKQIDQRKHIMGMFIWTGFDYRGEPTPFEWPSIGTQFGIMDTCGFKKDVYYLNKSFFVNEPVIHLLPHWNWSEGEEIRVAAYTNCDEAELFLNGESLGRQSVPKYDMANWRVPFEKGTLKVIGYRDNKAVCENETHTAGETKKLEIEPSREYLYDGCDDAIAVNVKAVDKNGFYVPNENALVRFTVEGGEVIGVGNGDPNSHEADKASERHLFHGLCQAIVKEIDGAEKVIIKAYADGIGTAETEIPVKRREDPINYIYSINEKYVATWRNSVALTDEKPDPLTEIEDSDMNTMGVIGVGAGCDDLFIDNKGWCMYRAKTEISDNDSMLVFREVTGERVEIYVNGEKRFDHNCENGMRAEFPLAGMSGECTLAVLAYSENGRGGISKPVVIV